MSTTDGGEVQAPPSPAQVWQRVQAYAWPLGAVGVPLALLGWLLWHGLVVDVGLHDNDWPLLMWLVKHSSWRDPSPLALGHYGPGQLLLTWWLGPFVGSTLTAAKLINAFCTAFCAWLLGSITRGVQGRFAAVLVMVLFATSIAALQTGQSEFGDPLAAALFFSGIWIWWRRDPERPGLAAGLLLGASGLIRTHFVFFSLAAAIVLGAGAIVCAREKPHRRRVLWSALDLVIGTVCANVPGFLLNWKVHGQIGSAVAHTFLGQVLFGVDEFDFYETYAAHPMTEVLRDHLPELLNHVAGRVRGNPWLWSVGVVSPLALLLEWGHVRRALVERVLVLSALSVLYFFLFVALGWVVTPRLIFPITALNWWLGVNVATLVLRSYSFGPIAAAVAAAVALQRQWPLALEQAESRAKEVRLRWSVSQELVQALRQRGLGDPREAFVFEWNRFLTDDPELQPFYNFGYWNLVIPAFREQRPIPTPYLADLGEFARFMQAQHVRFVVVPKWPRGFTSLPPLAAGEVPLPGYHRDVELTWDVLYVADP
jgi:hypothetical protein